jgi:hypothetical protein
MNRYIFLSKNTFPFPEKHNYNRPCLEYLLDASSTSIVVADATGIDVGCIKKGEQAQNCFFNFEKK